MKPSELQKQMSEYLRERGVSLSYAVSAGLRAVSGSEARDLGSPWANDAIVIPYLHPFIRKPHERLLRFRYITDPLPQGKEGKAVKFCQPKGSPVEAYFDPKVDWERVAKNAHIAVHFVEGEIKALAMNQRGLITIGLGGVDNFGGANLTPWLREVMG